MKSPCNCGVGTMSNKSNLILCSFDVRFALNPLNEYASKTLFNCRKEKNVGETSVLYLKRYFIFAALPPFAPEWSKFFTCPIYCFSLSQVFALYSLIPTSQKIIK